MTVNLIALSRCAAISGLRAHEMIVGATPSVKHSPLLAAYRLKLAKGRDAVRGMIVADIRDSVELGEIDFAADLLVVLRQFLTMCETADARGVVEGLRVVGERGGDFDPPSKSEARICSRRARAAPRPRPRKLLPKRRAQGHNIFFLEDYRRFSALPACRPAACHAGPEDRPLDGA